VSLKQQVGDDLGQRMQHALHETLHKYTPAVLIGTDCPGFTADYIRSALESARLNRTVIGPAEDGGYVLLGVKQIQPKLFDDMPWGSSKVYSKTIERITGKAESLLPLWDIDRIEDLRRLYNAADEFHLDIDFLQDLKALKLS
jgi:hypothetical protein